MKAHLIETVATMLQAADVPGAAVALLADGEPLVAEGVGFRDREGTSPLPADAQFYLYSITKTLIAATILKLVEAGSLALDKPAQTYLPELTLAEPVTVRQLLQHTSGMPDYGGMVAYHDAVSRHPGNPWTEDQFLRHTVAGGLRFAPGNGWAYSNIGYLLLKRLLQTITGLSLRRALHDFLFAPLNLKRTFVAETLADAEGLTPGYSSLFRADDFEDISRRYHPGWVSHGVAVSTAPETALLFHAIFAGRLLPAGLLEEMVTPVPVGLEHRFFATPAYGLGLILDPASAYGTVAGHGGGGPGYETVALHFPDVAGQTLIAVVLTNSDHTELAMPVAYHLIEHVATHSL